MIDPTPEPRPGAISTLPTRPAGTRATPSAGVTSTLPTRPVGGKLAPFTPAAVAAPPAGARRPRVIGLALGAVVLLIALIASVLLFLNPAAGSQGSVPFGEVLQFDDQGHTHIAKGQPHPTYNSDPPNSGWHREEFAPDPTKFIYDPPLDDEVSVHLMEHGNLIAWYYCGVGTDCTPIRDGLAHETLRVPPAAAYRLYVMPRTSLPGGAHIALAAWQHIEYLPSFDQQKVDDFLKRFGGAVQENMPVVTPKP